MKMRKARVQCGKTGTGHVTTRLTLPVPWCRAMGIIEERDILMTFDGQRIIIEKYQEEQA